MIVVDNDRGTAGASFSTTIMERDPRAAARRSAARAPPGSSPSHLYLVLPGSQQPGLSADGDRPAVRQPVPQEQVQLGRRPRRLAVRPTNAIRLIGLTRVTRSTPDTTRRDPGPDLGQPFVAGVCR